LNEP